jgi:serpin B
MKFIITIFIAFLFVANVSCQQQETNPDDNKIIQLDEKSAQLIESDNVFGLEIFREIREESNKENIMISPLSISVALAMAYNGAGGDTKTEMENALKLNGLTPEQINNSYKMLIAALQSLDEDVVFELANAIFYANGFEVKSPFLSTNQDFYDAKVESLDFSSPASLVHINNWVAEKTHDKIVKIVESLSPNDRMVLLNAIYFNGIWSVKFDEDGTKLHNFKKKGGANIEVPMMNKEDKLDYTTNSLFSAIKLPYGTGQYNMVVLLPGSDKNSADIIDDLSADNWNEWMKSFETEEHVVVTMPRFKFAFELQLNSVLKKMGMLKAFVSSQSDFTKITDDKKLYISSVVHKSFIDVNENGTEAAAVTSVTFSTTSIGPGDQIQKIYFTADKPFVFAITEKDTDAILFIGEMQNPEYEK